MLTAQTTDAFLQLMWLTPDMKNSLLVTWSVAALTAAAPIFTADIAAQSVYTKPLSATLGDQLAQKVAQGRAMVLQSDMVVGLESPAPPIKVENWLRGQSLASFQPGRVYIVEFWATWCKPCEAALSHLVQLQEKYKDSGVEVLGLAALERAQTADKAQNKLDAWLTKKLPNLNYRIGFDYTRKMEKLWLRPSHSVGIPTTFVVDRDGRIAFVGLTMQLDDVLPKVLTGSWRTSDEAKAAETERIAQDKRIMDEMAREKR